MEDDKPFACPLPECGMRFVNEDHLSVHKKKHDLSLSLTPSILRNPFIDQTPTPTRFLNALESELFQDLHGDNPFDSSFRRANSITRSNSQISIPESANLISSLPDSEEINTPSIILSSDSDVVLPSTSREKTVISLKKPVPRKERNNQSLDDSNETLPFVANGKLSSVSNAAKELSSISVVKNAAQQSSYVSSSSSTCSDITAVYALAEMSGISVSSEQRTRANVVPTSVITSVSSAVKANATCVPTAVVTRTVTNVVSSNSVSSVNHVTESSSQPKAVKTLPTVLQPVTVAPLLQFILRLPSGEAMPVQLPVTIATAVPTVNAQPVTAVSNDLIGVSNIQSNAKRKLKELITAQRNMNRNSSTVQAVSTDIPVVRQQTVHILPAQNLNGNLSSESPPSSPHSVQDQLFANWQKSNGKRRRYASDDPDEKRRKSLERNRAAATRCRQKRKQWITALEKKADEMARTNVHLQSEVESLRKEVAQLKTMLLAHKDCPVTLQQKACGIPEVTTIHHVPLQMAQVPLSVVSSSSSSTSNTQKMSVPVVEFIELENTSSLSGNASDNSEASV